MATGQNGVTPTIFIWKADTAEKVQKLKLPKGTRLVSAIGISPNDKYVAATDSSEKIEVHVFDIGKGRLISSTKVNYVVKHLVWHPSDDTVFATCGQDHLFYYDLNLVKA